jgi:hypothetical protein
MADRSFVRDSLGRFAKTAGQAAAKSAGKAAREAAQDAKRVAKARLDEKIADVQQELADARRDLKKVENPGRGADPHELVEYEELRKARRDDVRKQTLKLEALKVAARAARKL